MGRGNSTNRSNVIAKHAKDRISLSIVAAIIYIFTISLITLLFDKNNEIIMKLFNRLSGPHSVYITFCMIIIGFIAISFRRPGIVYRLRRIRHIIHYIPLWWVAVSSVFLILTILSFRDIICYLGLPVWIINAPVYNVLILIFSFGMLAQLTFWMYWELQDDVGIKSLENVNINKKMTQSYYKYGNSIFKQPELFIEWITTEKPVSSIDDDYMGTELIAQRIVNRLQVGESATHVVVGPLGSGKSTIGEFVKFILMNDVEKSNTRVIRIELWPFLTPSAALEGILNRIIDELGKEIEIMHLKLVPNQYIDLLESLSGFTKSIGRLLRGFESNPEEILSKINEQAMILKIHIVIWIDDLERFAGKQTDDIFETPGESARLSPIRSLLHALSNQNSITVIIATTSLMSGFDWDKIARYIHEVPLISPDYSYRVLKYFREHSLKGFLNIETVKTLDHEYLRNAWIDPTPENFQNKLWGEKLSGSHLEHQEEILRTGGLFSTPQAMAMLCKTPRSLKQGLRRVNEIWQPNRMKGEFQFDQLLALCLLREGCPIGFSVLMSHLPQLQRLERMGDFRFYQAKLALDDIIKQHAGSVDSDRLKSSKLFLNHLIDALSAFSDKTAIHFVADLWQSGLDSITLQAVIQITEHILLEQRIIGPQSFRISPEREDIYWRLYIDDQDSPPELRDQLFLRSVLSSSKHELVDILANPFMGPALVDFSFVLRMDWSGVLYHLVSSHHSTGWKKHIDMNNYSWLNSIFKILRKEYEAGRLQYDFLTEFENSFKLALEIEPSLAGEIEQIFLEPDRTILWFGQDVNLDDIHAKLRAVFKEMYFDNINDLVDKLKYPWTLSQLCFGPSYGGGDKNVEIDDVLEWCPEFFQSILSVMSNNTQIRDKMLHQIAYILVGKNNELKVDLGEVLFGNMTDLYRIVRGVESKNFGGDRSIDILIKGAHSNNV